MSDMVPFDIGDFVPVATEKSTIDHLKERFRERRKERKLSQKALALRSGVSYASIRRFEQTGEISLRSLVKLANAIGCLPDFEKLFTQEFILSVKDYRND